MTPTITAIQAESEYEHAIKLANWLMDETDKKPGIDPDDNLRILSRQFLRQIERTERAITQTAEVICRDASEIGKYWCSSCGGSGIDDDGKSCDYCIKRDKALEDRANSLTK